MKHLIILLSILTSLSASAEPADCLLYVDVNGAVVEQSGIILDGVCVLKQDA